MKSIPFLSAFLLLASSAFAQDVEEVPYTPIPYEGAFEMNLGVWDTFDADEGFYFTLAARVPVDERIEVIWGVEMSADVGTDLVSSDPLDCVGPNPCEFDVEIYGTFLTIMITPQAEWEPGAVRFAVGGGGGVYVANFTEYGNYWYDDVVDSDVSFGTHAVAEIEWIYNDNGWFKIQARRIWLDFAPETFVLPSGLRDVSDFSGWQVSIGWGLMF